MAPATPLPALALAGQASNVPLTRVSLAYIEARFKFHLRFGEPARTLRLDCWRRCAVFLPRAMFCRVRWEANDYGTIRWQLMVMQAATPLDDAAIPACGRPHACCCTPKAKTRCVPCWNASTASKGKASPPSTSSAYWRTLGNCLAARLALPEYTAERHAAWLAGRALP